MSGSRKLGSIPTFPEVSIQSIVAPAGDWWLKDPAYAYNRGRLVMAFLPHVSQVPLVICAEGRKDPAVHTVFRCSLKPLDVKRPKRKGILPVAALSTPESEVRAVYRAKKRPAVIVAEEGVSLPGEFTLGKPAWQTAPTLLVAPYYGTEESDKREGFNPAFLDRVLKCEYSRFMLDWLPIEGSPGGSLLRIDHIQPIGSHHNSLEPTIWRLNDEALNTLDEWICWHFEGKLAEDTNIAATRGLFLELDSML